MSKTDEMDVMEKQLTEFGFHEGNALLHIANTYPTISAVILENIQNALDALARDVWVVIRFHKGSRERKIVIRDNGLGISRKKLTTSLTQVCSTMKAEDDLGRFGIGLVSPLGKCDEFLVTSAAKEAAHIFHRWTFNTKKLKEQKSIKGIPFEQLNDLVFVNEPGQKAAGKKAVTWRTEIEIKNFTRDRLLSKVNLAELRNEIVDRYGQKMKKNNSTVHLTLILQNGDREELEFQAQSFQGKKLDNITYESDKCGKTFFSLYISPKLSKGRQGRILIGTKDNAAYRINFLDFARHTEHGLISDEVTRVLASGKFEGEIINEKCLLHPDRKRFATNDALVEFLVHLEQWVNHHGLKHISDLEDEDKGDKLNALGKQAMNHLENILRNDLSHLKGVIKELNEGSIGPGHKDYNDDLPKADIKTQAGEKKPADKEQFTLTEKQETQKDQKEHAPFTVAGPKGRHRRLVKGHSCGLTFDYAEVAGGKLYRFNDSNGLIEFNTLHPLWEKAEKNNSVLIRFQVYIGLQVLNTMMMPKDMREILDIYLDEHNKSSLSFIYNIETTRARRPRAEVGKKLILLCTSNN